AAAGNIKGWGPFTVSLPRSVVPSSEYHSSPHRWPHEGTPVLLQSRCREHQGLGALHCVTAEECVSITRVLAAGLTRGHRYFFRAAAGNIKGWGPFTVSLLRSVVPSSEYHSGPRRRPHEGTPVLLQSRCREHQGVGALHCVTAEEGVYLACILYHEDKVLVTSEEFLPVIEVSCSWDEVKSLRSDMEKHTSSSIHFRLKLLTAAAQMQSALCVQDLGQLYHKPLRDSHGTVVLSCVNSVKSVKSVSALNSRWVPVSRLRRRVLSEDNTIGELLMASVHEQIAYHQVSQVQLARGLYLGYLKLQSSVEVVRIVAPARAPNVPPHTRVRDNPHGLYLGYLKLQSSVEVVRIVAPARAPNVPPHTRVRDNPHGLYLGYLKLQSSVKVVRIVALARAPNVPLHTRVRDNPHQVQLARGLYLGYLKLQSSVEVVRIVAPARAPNVPPHTRVRDNPHVSASATSAGTVSWLPEAAVVGGGGAHRGAGASPQRAAAHARPGQPAYLSVSIASATSAGTVSWLPEAAVVGGGGAHRGAGASPQCAAAHARPGQPACLSVSIASATSAGTVSWLPEAAVVGGGGAHRGAGASPQRAAAHARPGQPACLSVSIASATSAGTVSWLPEAAVVGGGGAHRGAGASPQRAAAHVRPGLPACVSVSGQEKPSESQEMFLDQIASAARRLFKDMDITPECVISHRIYDLEVIELNSDVSFVMICPPAEQACCVPGQKEILLQRGDLLSNVSESAQSLSSDSESQSCPLTTVPLKIRPQVKHFRSPCNVIPSKSMTNVKAAEVDFTDTGQEFVQKSMSVKRQPLLETQEDGEYNNKVPKTDERSEERIKAPEQRTPDQPGILQVFAAYETGLAAGTSLKLHVTPRTSAREVIDLVVKQLNMAAVLKGKSGPVYGPEKLQDFCLVAVIGARERCLRDDFRPLQLQNPWRKGRLYVRLKHDVLAALQHSAKQPAYI
ncbi:Cytoskeletal structural protein, partial [Operophtera brumata]